jgi:hypothetical protein
MASDDFPAPREGFVLTQFIVASHVPRSRDFYTGVLGGTVVLDGHLIEVGQTTGVLPDR